MTDPLASHVSERSPASGERPGALERAEGLTEHLSDPGAPKKRMLVIVNPYATTVSDRLRNLVVYALESRYEVEAVDTEKRDHATQICREAASEGYDVVVAFGGDGTVNEAANGLAGSDTPLTCLPGGATNVFCRALGFPTDVVDATERLLGIADDFQPRRVDLGRVNERHFVFASGVGLDASVVERVDSHPRLKSRLGEWYYTYAAVSTFSRKYLVKAPRVRVSIGETEVEGVTAIVQNSDPYTFFGRHPIRICEGAGLETGSLGLAVLTRATPLELATLGPRIFSPRPGAVAGHRQIQSFPEVEGATVEGIGGHAFPLEVDGDFIGEFNRVTYGVDPGALVVVS